MPVRYRRILKFHPLPAVLRPRWLGDIELRGYPEDASDAVHQAACRALITIGLTQDIGLKAQLGPVLMDCRTETKEFFVFRQRAIEAIARHALETTDESSTQLEIACWRVFQPGVPAKLDAHLDALAEVWLSGGASLSANDVLTLGVAVEDRGRFLARHFAIAALLEFDAALICRAQGNHDAAMDAAVCGGQSARSSFDIEVAASGPQGAMPIERQLAELHRMRSRKGGIERHRKSGKHSAKVAVFKMWCRWNAGELAFASVAEFARAAVGEHEALESTQVIERWARKWESGEDTLYAELGLTQPG